MAGHGSWRVTLESYDASRHSQYVCLGNCQRQDVASKCTCVTQVSHHPPHMAAECRCDFRLLHCSNLDFSAIFCLRMQVAVLTNHQNGRDTHIRQILLFGPGSAQTGSSISSNKQLETLESSMFSTIR